VGRFTATCAGAVDASGNSAPPVSTSWSVAYVFTGIWSPKRLEDLRSVKAGSTVPLHWRITDAAGTPVTGLRTAVLTSRSCAGGATTAERSPGSSGLQDLGGGDYQLNWARPRRTPGPAGSCPWTSVRDRT
jgi:hypothetical protein